MRLLTSRASKKLHEIGARRSRASRLFHAAYRTNFASYFNMNRLYNARDNMGMNCLGSEAAGREATRE